MVELERLVGLLHAEEKLRGHPTLKALHNQVMDELHKLVPTKPDPAEHAADPDWKKPIERRPIPTSEQSNGS